MTNLAHNDYENKKFEMIDGKIYMMATPNHNHISVVGNLYTLFRNYLRGKKCMVYSDNNTLYLSDRNKFIPDLMVVCNPDIIKHKGIYGAPDLVVEVLSRSTSKNDKGYKKDLYEQYGIKEYWIIDPERRMIEVYLHNGERYILDNVYGIYSEFDLDILDHDGHDISAIPKEFSPSIFPDLAISIEEVFENVGMTGGV